jgi:hypothetical protein
MRTISTFKPKRFVKKRFGAIIWPANDLILNADFANFAPEYFAELPYEFATEFTGSSA